MPKIKTGGLYQYGTEPFEQQQFETAGVEGVNAFCFLRCKFSISFSVIFSYRDTMVINLNDIESISKSLEQTDRQRQNVFTTQCKQKIILNTPARLQYKTAEYRPQNL